MNSRCSRLPVLRLTRWKETRSLVEAGAGVLQHARLVLGLPCMLAITADENVASIRVLEKIGLVFDRIFEHPSHPAPSRLYRMDLDPRLRH